MLTVHEFDGFLPPEAIESEMCALGCMLLSDIAAGEVMRVLAPTMFDLPAHQTVYRVMLQMLEGGLKLDAVSLKLELQRLDLLQVAGGVEYLIQHMESVATAEHASTYAQIVRRNHVRRVAAQRFRNLADECPTLDIAELESRAGEVMNGLSGFATQHIRGDEIDLETLELAGVRTPLKALNEAIEDCQGLPRGQITAVVATKKGGKTSVMTDWAWNAACDIAEGRPWVKGKRVAYITVADLPPAQLKRRMLRQFAGITSKPERGPGLYDGEQYEALLTKWNNAVYRNEWSLIHFYDGAKRFGGDVHQICAWLEAEHERKPWEAVFVDYFQKLKAGEKDRVRDLEKVSSACSQCAARMETPAFVIGSQISETGRTRYSQELEDDGGAILRFSRDEGLGNAGTLEIAYNRFGPSCSLPIWWDERRLRYGEEA